MAEKKTKKKAQARVPKSDDELTDFIRQIGQHQRDLARIEAGLNEDVERIKARSVKDSRPHQDAIDALFEGIFVFAQKQRAQLTDAGKAKTVHLTTGDIQWRMTPRAVTLRGVEKIIAFCKANRMLRFIRTKEEVNKEAMLAEPDVAGKIIGVTIGQHEEFVVVPSEVKIEVTKKVEKLKKSVED